MLALAGEGALLGAIGGLIGVVAGLAAAAVLLQRYGADLGGGYFAGEAALETHPLALLTAVGLSILVAALGAWWPARAALRTPAAQALKAAAPPREASPRRFAGPLAALAFASLGAAALRISWPTGLPRSAVTFRSPACSVRV